MGLDAEHGDVVSWTDRRWIDLAGAATPIIQAPMAGAGGVDLAVAAMRGGGVGSLPCALLTPDAVREQVAMLRARATGPINLNFFCHTMPPPPDEADWRALLSPYYAEYGVGPPDEAPPLRLPFDAAMCAVVEEVRPDIVSFHFGLPDRPLLKRVRAAARLVIASATGVESARRLAAAGVDAVIAQGWEAGGHASDWLPTDAGAPMGLMALVPQIADAVGVPVIAAGGIADARGIAAALALGASAVQLGTAYLHCPESLIHPAHRAALAGPEAELTAFTNLISGGRARGLPGRLTRDLGPIRAEAPPYPYAASALAPLRQAAEAEGDLSFSPAWAGQSARLGRAGEPAEALTRRLAAEALALLGAKA
ncbi:nitronate monooxygenase family protein [Sphingosinicella ginsenosidimutans]|uniref:Nitronate monooxygenase n=1 Tax=Allosphingosinicella ginsenosidimutans TaxID=1176539 RepID=A0A5C6TT34_9SPHN|nr:nitronate monooxygenase [Sphingosinicella ginsenosidimutans]TXC63340.1 nitronate monooxygenase [Sphingosinicella ginsenosidimutans]